VGVELGINNCATKVVGSGYVVVDSVTLSLRILHRVRGSTLLGEMDNSIGLFILNKLNKEIVLLCYINIFEGNVFSRNLLPCLDTDLRETRNITCKIYLIFQFYGFPCLATI
jgi:hypothetical protein